MPLPYGRGTGSVRGVRGPTSRKLGVCLQLLADEVTGTFKIAVSCTNSGPQLPVTWDAYSLQQFPGPFK